VKDGKVPHNAWAYGSTKQEELLLPCHRCIVDSLQQASELGEKAGPHLLVIHWYLHSVPQEFDGTIADKRNILAMQGETPDQKACL